MKRAVGRRLPGLGGVVVATVVTIAAALAAMPGAQAATTPGWRITQVWSDGSGPVSVTAIAADSAKDAWVAESRNPGEAMVLQHWDGTSWQPLQGPASFHGADNAYVIGATSASDLWTFPTVNGASVTQYGLRWNGHSWTTFNLHSAQIWAAAVFGPTSAWAFGQQPGNPTPAGFTRGYAAHYDGHAWKQFAVPGAVVGTAGLAGNDIWAVSALSKPGSYAALHWNGAKWGSMAIPVLPAISKDSWVVTGFAATARTSIWVAEIPALNRGTGLGPRALTLLHWNGSKWSVAVRETAWYLGGMTPDGRGGFWFVGHQPQEVGYPAFDTTIVHYTGGHWVTQAVPAKSGYSAGAGFITPIPGTSSFWALGLLDPTGNPGFTSAAILKYGP